MLSLLLATDTTPNKPGSFVGAHHPIRRFRHHKVECYLRSQKAYALHKQVQKHFPHHKMLWKRIADLYQVDLVDQLSMASNSDSYHYVLTCIDVFSKTALEMTEAFEKNTCVVRLPPENAADRQGHPVSQQCFSIF